MKLYTYFQSSGAYRVRIALALKGIKAEMVFVDLTKGEQKDPRYAAINPQMLVPSFIDNTGHVLTQSLAIIEYLEEKFPAPALLPLAPLERARVRAISYAMAMDIAPINNLSQRKYVKAKGMDEKEWIQHWTHNGLAPLEKMLAESPMTGRFCHGAYPTMADCVLVPQLAHARRFGCDLSHYPTLTRIDAACNDLSAFQLAHPSKQPDAV
jgi:maleylpyruvate isomerase